MILFKCHQCHGALKTSNPKLIGKKIKCPKCGAAVPVPAESGVVPAMAPGPPTPGAARPKAGPSTKSTPSKPPPALASDWEEDEAPPLPRPKGKKPVRDDDWEEEETPAAKPATKPRKKGGIDLMAILVFLLLAGYIAALVLIMLDIVQI